MYLWKDSQDWKVYSLIIKQNRNVLEPIPLMTLMICVYQLNWELLNDNFKITYFAPPTQDAECAYFNFPELLSLRTALILHLQRNKTLDVRTEFSGCLSQEWKSFLDESYPYFLIVADEGLNDLQTHLFNFLIIQSWAMKINAVLSSGQASNIFRLYAYFMPSKYSNQVFFKQVTYFKIL